MEIILDFGLSILNVHPKSTSQDLTNRTTLPTALSFAMRYIISSESGERGAGSGERGAGSEKCGLGLRPSRAPFQDSGERGNTVPHKGGKCCNVSTLAIVSKSKSIAHNHHCQRSNAQTFFSIPESASPCSIQSLTSIAIRSKWYQK